MTEEEIFEALDILVKDGRVWAKCPRCDIPLSYKEYSKTKCNTCGKFKVDDVKFYPKTEQC